jgi:hypothetical protein
VRDRGDGRVNQVELDVRLGLRIAPAVSDTVAAALVKPVSFTYWIALELVRPGVSRSRTVMRRCAGVITPSTRCGTIISPAEPSATVVSRR